MSETLIDARGLACPEPVLRARKAITQADATNVVVLVDDQDSAENITRMAGTLGWNVTSQQTGKEVRLSLTNAARPASETESQGQAPTSTTAAPTVVVYVSSNLFGETQDSSLNQSSPTCGHNLCMCFHLGKCASSQLDDGNASEGGLNRHVAGERFPCGIV